MSTTLTHLTPAELDALLGAAKTATPGPWTTQAGTFWICDIGSDGDAVWSLAYPPDETPFPYAKYEDDAAFIAAANPATITRLVLMVRELQQENEQLRLPIRAQATTER